MAMQDSDFTETDVSHIGSDEEPPCDSVLDKVVIAYDVNAVKYLIHTGKGYDKPGRGDVIKMRWTPIKQKSSLWCLFSKESCSLNELTILEEEIQVWFNETGITTSGELGYNVKIPFVIEETIKTMKMDEVCVVLCDNHNEWIDGCEKITIIEESRKRYDIFRKEKKKKKHGFKKLYKEKEQLVHCIAYVVHLQTFSKRFALNEERTILIESLIDAFPGAVSPKKYDIIHYSWSTFNENTFEKPSWNYSLTKLCEDNLLPNAKLFLALLSMKVGQTSKIILRNLEAQEICTLCVRLDHVFSNDIISCEDPWNLSSYGTHQLKYQEFVECQEGMKKQVIVEEGCRVVALLSLRSVHEECFGPFHCIHDSTKNSSKASLVSWTLGSNSVPYWMDTIVLNLKPRCRVRVALKNNSFMLSEEDMTPSLWNTFSETVLVKNNAWIQFNPKDVQDVLQWNEIYLSHEESLQEPIEAWLNIASSKDGLNVTHLFQSKEEPFVKILHHLDITQSIEKFHNNQWSLKNSSSEQIQFLSSWLCQPNNIAKWAICDSFLKTNSDDDCFLDIQLIEILNRQPKQWTINESNRLIWGTLYKLFANYLLQKQYWNLALKYYRKALESIRFSPLLDYLEYCEIPQQENFMMRIITRKDIDSVSLEPIEDLYQCIMCNIIQLYLSSKRWIDAIHASKKIKKISKPMYIKALHRLSLAYFNLQNYTESRTIIIQCCSLDPINNEFKKLLNKINLAIRDSMQREKHLFKNIFLNEHHTNTLITINNNASF